MAPRVKKGDLLAARRQGQAAAKIQLGLRPRRGSGIEPEQGWLDACVKKILREKFRNWAQLLLDGVVVGESTLTQRLYRGKRYWCLAGEPAFGARYYQILRKQYAASSPTQTSSASTRSTPTTAGR